MNTQTATTSLVAAGKEWASARKALRNVLEDMGNSYVESDGWDALSSEEHFSYLEFRNARTALMVAVGEESGLDLDSVFVAHELVMNLPMA